MILAGDIGGTNSRLGVFDANGKTPAPLRVEVFPSENYFSLIEILHEFLGDARTAVSSACFGLPGPVINGVVTTSNLPWVVIMDELRQTLQTDRVEIVNDLEANAHGISALGPESVVTLSPGASGASGNIALISAGTGLGEAGLYWNGEAWQPFASEGGHVDFAPRNELEAAMLTWMLRRYSHVSYERFLSGPGLHNIYKFLIEYGCGQEPEWLAARIAEGSPGAEIAKAAMERNVEVCQTAMDRFVSIYGAEAGNLALKMLASGGVYIGGGIAPKILSELKKPRFMESFLNKGRMRSLLEQCPVKVIINDQTALLGAARVALFGVRMETEFGESVGGSPVPI